MFKPERATAFLLAGTVLLIIALCGCQTAGSLVLQPQSSMKAFPLTESSLFFALQDEGGETEAGEDEKEQSTLSIILLYIPNRIFDAFDMVRAGVNVGP